MDLTPLYDLRERLRAGAIAGAALTGEDFRLSRALEALGPLEKAAPVFAKLGQLTRALLAPDCPDRAGTLLEALSLADAVLCTQGAVSVSGPVAPLPIRARGKTVTNAPYSLLMPLLDALTTSGGGRYSLVLETHQQRPDVFEDYRVKDAMVSALGASYSELAEQVQSWLSQEDEGILPLIKHNFDPRGKKEMVRRVQVIEAVSGAKENDFYLEQIPKAEGDVRAALVYALRHNPGNVEKLVELCKTEKGSSKKMAHWALSKLDDPVAWAYWDKLAEKKPEQVAVYMPLATTSKASTAIADAVVRWLEPFEADSDRPVQLQDAEKLQALIEALPGKSGPEICAVYRRMAALGTRLDNKMLTGGPKSDKEARFKLLWVDHGSHKNWVFSEMVDQVLLRSILYHPTPDLLALPAELEAHCETSFLASALTAALLSKPAEEVYELAKPLLTADDLFNQKKRQYAWQVLDPATHFLAWDQEEHRLLFNTPYHNYINGGYLWVKQPVLEPLDRRWYKDLQRPKEAFAWYDLLRRIVDLDDEPLRLEVGEYFYQQALKSKDASSAYLHYLRHLGWTKCEGLAVHYCKTKGKLAPWEVHSYLTNMPGSLEDRKAEGWRVYALLEKGEFQYQLHRGRGAQAPQSLDHLKSLIETLPGHTQ
ncbi:MAG: hypothetical protein HFE97_02005 [Oscillospiraceae bacterium]|nr:hypothetical protein [Oscillospiraceae bacterium]